MNKPIELKMSTSEAITMLEKSERIFVVQLVGHGRPDAIMLVLDEIGNKPCSVLLTTECWGKVKTKKVLAKCTFGSQPGKITQPLKTKE